MTCERIRRRFKFYDAVQKKPFIAATLWISQYAKKQKVLLANRTRFRQVPSALTAVSTREKVE
jgi:hypothetical protein